jgi:DNA-binding MarR family transcriptional regulator
MTSRVYQQMFGISIAEWRVMSMLAIEPNITAARVCESRSLDAAAVSRSIRVLQARGDVRATEDDFDGRQQRLALTPQGGEFHDRIVEVALELERRFLAGFTAAEIELLISLLDRFRENASALAANFEKTGEFQDLPRSLPPEQPAEKGAGGQDCVETHVLNGRLHIKADVGSDGITRVQQILGKYSELLRIMS